MQPRLVLCGYAATSKATRNGYGCNMRWLCEGGSAGRINLAPGGTALAQTSACRSRNGWDVMTRLRRRSGTRVAPADYGRDLATGVEKRPTDRFQKARYRLVTLVNHPKSAGKRADADGLPIGWKIGQQRRPPDGLEP